MKSENPRQAGRRLTLALPLVLLGALLLMGAGCTAPTPEDQPASGEPAAAAAAVPTPIAAAPATPAPVDASPARDSRSPPRQAPPMSDPLPPVRAPEREVGRAPRTAPAPAPAPVEVPAGAPVKIDTNCTRDADCVVKNVGNCCGYYPACVNVNSPTDPAAVQAQCARTGAMSVCGFPSISACQCVAGKCEGDSAAVEQ